MNVPKDLFMLMVETVECLNAVEHMDNCVDAIVDTDDLLDRIYAFLKQHEAEENKFIRSV